MANRTGKCASAILGGFLAVASLLACQMGASAAECLTERRQDTPKGQHWYYHIDHGTKRQCWYLRAQDGKLSPATRSTETPNPKAVARQSESSARLEDARAELKAARPAAQDSAVDPAQTSRAPSVRSLAGPYPDPAQNDARGSPLSSRWPAPAETTSSGQPPPLAADSSDLQPSQQAAPALVQPPPVAANPAAERHSVSLQMLLVVIFAALTLAGLTASVVYSFGRGWRIAPMDAHQRRVAIRESFDNAPKPTSAAPWIEAVESSAPQRSEPPRRRALVQAGNQERGDKIEAILAQLVKQAQQSEA